MKDKKIKEHLIEFYEKLLESAIKKENYEDAIKYKKFIENLKQTGVK